MPRQARVSVANVIYHVINRANGRTTIFHNEKEYCHFISLVKEARDLTDMRILGYCIMPNHWHFILYPKTDTQLSEFMSWLTSTHVRQYRTKTKTIGYGHLYQDRYKSFPVETNEYLQTLIRYVEQNPLRAKIVKRAEDWIWSSLYVREKESDRAKKLLAELPFDLPINYLESVNDSMNKESLELVRVSVNKGTPYGKDGWVKEMVTTHGLVHTTRGKGRPKIN